MNWVVRFENIIDLVTEYICIIAFGIIVILGAMQVFFRYVVGYSIFWAEEVIRYIFIWLVWFGIAVGIKTKIHASMDLILRSMGKRISIIIQIIYNLIILIFTVYLIFSSGWLVLITRGSLTPSTQISFSWVYLSLPIGLIFIFYYVAKDFSFMVKKLKLEKTESKHRR